LIEHRAARIIAAYRLINGQKSERIKTAGAASQEQNKIERVSAGFTIDRSRLLPDNIYCLHLYTFPELQTLLFLIPFIDVSLCCNFYV
jgi:hypothetical protein